jgi:hypothetical protein
LKTIPCPEDNKWKSYEQECFAYTGGYKGKGEYVMKIQRRPLFEDVKKSDASLAYDLFIDPLEI